MGLRDATGRRPRTAAHRWETIIGERPAVDDAPAVDENIADGRDEAPSSEDSAAAGRFQTSARRGVIDAARASESASGTWRWLPSPRLSVLLVVLLGLGCMAWLLLPPAGQAVSHVESSPSLSASPSSVVDGPAGSSATPSSPLARASTVADGHPLLVVHVSGQVKHPGVYRLAGGSRVADAVAAAGGTVDGGDENRLNLAEPLRDGVKIEVPHLGDAAAPPLSAASPEAPTGSGNVASLPVNLNTASAAELELLPEVGPVLAQKIVDYRDQLGRFAAVEELDAVSGIGPKLLETLRPLVAV